MNFKNNPNIEFYGEPPKDNTSLYIEFFSQTMLPLMSGNQTTPRDDTIQKLKI